MPAVMPAFISLLSLPDYGDMGGVEGRSFKDDKALFLTMLQLGF